MGIELEYGSNVKGGTQARCLYEHDITQESYQEEGLESAAMRL
jgi:hypothetical protein